MLITRNIILVFSLFFNRSTEKFSTENFVNFSENARKAGLLL